MNDKTLVERLIESKPVDCEKFARIFGIECCDYKTCSSCIYAVCCAIADTIEREYLPRPRFEDGEPVKIGDKFENYFGKSEYIEEIQWIPNKRYALKSESGCYAYKAGERVKRPEPEVLDADGVTIRKGDTVYLTKQNGAIRPFEVKGFNGGYVLVAYRDRNPDEEQGDWNSYLGAQLTHKQPDSLERLLNDLEKEIVPQGVIRDRLLSIMERGL